MSRKLTPEEAIDLLKDCQSGVNESDNHRDADNILADFLRTMGYDDLVDEYEQVEKWY